MTLISKLGYMPLKQLNLSSPRLLSTREVTIVIPVKNNQKGVDAFLKAFFDKIDESDMPAEIIIVDNNSRPEIRIAENYLNRLRLVRCKKIGPAAARNLGASLATTDWIHFTDSDCIPTPSLLTGYLSAQNGALAYAGDVKAYKQGVFSRYYESQEILVPPKVYTESEVHRPDYIITANCLVWKPAFERVGGFNETIQIAGGEDIDLGFKLRTIGQLSYAFDSVANHNFEEDIWNFRERFRRYGKGNRIVGQLYNLDLTPSPFVPNERKFFNYLLALIQYLSMRKGYLQIR